MSGSVPTAIIPALPGFFVVDIEKGHSTDAGASIDGVPHRTGTRRAFYPDRRPVVGWFVVPTRALVPIIPGPLPARWALEIPGGKIVAAADVLGSAERQKAKWPKR
jgi:hypothetical protein